ncbi:MAG: D-arabitol-phosphate dehydrogenase [Lentisphaerae bacterium ADurb.BinA184]|nr:MAG: D-arabitol-phosphate dehydrogenase [Lentisphaerae bacterium ADurb.BinA184]
MRAIVNTALGRLEMRVLPRPRPGPGQVCVRTLACGICATDLAMIAGWQRTGFPAIPGHEWAGRVEELGAGVAADVAGRLCVAENVLADGGEVGFEHPGGYAEYFLTEAGNLQFPAPGMAATTAVLAEPLAVAVRGLRRLRLEQREGALIFGDGPVGLLMTRLLAHAGVGDIWLVGGRPARLAAARRLGARRTLNYHQMPGGLAATVGAAIGRTFLNVVEASGSAAAIEAALDAAARGGKVLVLGDYADAQATFRWNHLLHRELELIGSNASAGAWPEAVRLLAEFAEPLAGLVTHVVPAERFDEGLERVRHDRDAIKVVLDWRHGAD